MVRQFALVAIALNFLYGCASVTGTPNQSVSVEARDQGGKQVSGAACELTNNKGKWFVTTPGSVMIHRSNDDVQVLCNRDGFEPGRAAVVSDTKGSMFGNILLGGGVGALIDHNNGSAYEYPTLIQVLMGSFTRIGVPKQQAVADSPSAVSTPSPRVIAPQADLSSAAARTKEDRLRELKELYDKGLIAESTYLSRQREILMAEN